MKLVLRAGTKWKGRAKNEIKCGPRGCSALYHIGLALDSLLDFINASTRKDS